MTYREFTVTDVNHVMRLLTDLYTNPRESAIREYVANAMDANRQAGSDEPVSVMWFEGDLFITDSAGGMDGETALELLSGYGSTTKVGDSRSAGEFGIGAKAGLAISESIGVYTRKDGVQSNLRIFRTEESAGVDLESTEEWFGAPGTAIVIPDQHQRLFRLAQEYLKRYPKGTVDFGTGVPSLISDRAMIVDTTSNSPLFMYRGIVYPQENTTSLPAVPEAGSGRRYVLLIGDDVEMDVAPNREAFVQNRNTSMVLNELLEEFQDEIHAHVYSMRTEFADRHRATWELNNLVTADGVQAHEYQPSWNYTSSRVAQRLDSSRGGDPLKKYTSLGMSSVNKNIIKMIRKGQNWGAHEKNTSQRLPAKIHPLKGFDKYTVSYRKVLLKKFVAGLDDDEAEDYNGNLFAVKDETDGLGIEWLEEIDRDSISNKVSVPKGPSRSVRSRVLLDNSKDFGIYLVVSKSQTNWTTRGFKATERSFMDYANVNVAVVNGNSIPKFKRENPEYYYPEAPTGFLLGITNILDIVKRGNAAGAMRWAASGEDAKLSDLNLQPGFGIMRGTNFAHGPAHGTWVYGHESWSGFSKHNDVLAAIGNLLNMNRASEESSGAVKVILNVAESARLSALEGMLQEIDREATAEYYSLEKRLGGMFGSINNVPNHGVWPQLNRYATPNEVMNSIEDTGWLPMVAVHPALSKSFVPKEMAHLFKCAESAHPLDLLT